MSWFNLALLNALTIAVALIIESHLLSRRIPSLQAFLLLGGVFLLIFTSAFSRLFPLPDGTSVAVLLTAVVSGIVRAAAAIIMLYNLKREEVSRVIPVVYSYPIFVAIMAVPLLGESLHYLEWLAIIIVVGGAIMISVRRSSSGAATWRVKPMLLLFCASMLFALADITSKYVLTYISAWHLLWLSMFSLSGIYMLTSIRPRTFKQLSNLKQKKSVIGLLALNETLLFVGIILAYLAIEKGPVSLVSTILGSRPIFVVIIALILSRVSPMFLDWQPGKGMLALRFIAVAMIVGGIAIINMT